VNAPSLGWGFALGLLIAFVIVFTLTGWGIS
jgi:hypothetical protein